MTCEKLQVHPGEHREGVLRDSKSTVFHIMIEFITENTCKGIVLAIEAACADVNPFFQVQIREKQMCVIIKISLNIAGKGDSMIPEQVAQGDEYLTGRTVSGTHSKSDGDEVG